MNGILGALFPVFAVILIGYVLRRARFVAFEFWTAAERITFYVFFPALLVGNTAKADLAGLALGPMVAALLGAIACVLAVAFVLRRPLALDGPALTSLIQSAIRPNVYVAIAAAVALYGDAGLTAVSVCIAIVVPSVNIVSIFVLVRYAGVSAGGNPAASSLSEWGRVGRGVVSNPLILACALGLTLNATGVGLPPLSGPLLEILGRASLPIGLLAVGAGLDVAALNRVGAGVAAASALKLAMLPLLTWAMARALGLDGATGGTVVLLASVPVSASAYVMARQMGGDAAIMAGAITATTLAAVVTMPLVLSLPI